MLQERMRRERIGQAGGNWERVSGISLFHITKIQYFTVDAGAFRYGNIEQRR